MVQGAPKKASSTAKSSHSHHNKHPLGPKPGAKVIKPKKAKLVAKNKMLKVYKGKSSP
jgi:hypothetical protein